MPTEYEAYKEVSKIDKKNKKEFFSNLLGLPAIKQELATSKKSNSKEEDKPKDQFDHDEIERFKVDMIRSLNFYKKKSFMVSSVLWAPVTFFSINFAILSSSIIYIIGSLLVSAIFFSIVKLETSHSSIYIPQIEKFLTKHNKFHKNDRTKYVLYSINRGLITDLDELIFVAYNKKAKGRECIVFKNQTLTYYSAEQFEGCEIVHNDLVIDLKGSQLVLQNMARIR